MTDWHERADDLTEALQHIVQWSDAYPIDMFPEPDLKKARELLAAGGITLDAVSAHCMRHVVEGVGKIARDALSEGKDAMNLDEALAILAHFGVIGTESRVVSRAREIVRHYAEDAMKREIANVGEDKSR